MMPSDIRHQKYSLFADENTIRKKEEHRRRLIRYQQVKEESKIISSKVLEAIRKLRDREEYLIKRLNELKFEQWKIKQTKLLEKQLEYDLQSIGESHRAVEAELEVIRQRKEKLLHNNKLAIERGLRAQRLLQERINEENLNKEKIIQTKREVKEQEKGRSKTIVSTLTSSSTQKFTSGTNKSQPITLPSSKSSSTGLKSCLKISIDKENKTTTKVFDYRIPITAQTKTLSDNIIHRVSPNNLESANDIAEQEIINYIEKEREFEERQEYIDQLGEQATAKLTINKQYQQFIDRVSYLQRVEEKSRPDVLVTLADLDKLERKHNKKYKKKSKDSKDTNTRATMEPERDQHDGAEQPPKRKLTVRVPQEFTPEEQNLLGGAATSLKSLLDNLLGGSCQRLAGVFDAELDFKFDDHEIDEDYDYNPSPKDSPEGQRKLDSQQASSSGQSASTSQQASSNKDTDTDKKQQSGKLKDSDEKQGSSGTKRKSKNKKQSCELSISQELTVSPMSQDSSVTSTSEVVLTVDKRKKKKKKSKSKNVPTSNSDDKQGEEKKKQENAIYSLISNNSTEYHSPPEHLASDENIERYLEKLEKEKVEVKLLIEKKKEKSKKVEVPKYVDKLLGMTRKSVDALSVSDATETSTEVSFITSNNKKRNRRRRKGKQSTSTSSDSTLSIKTSASDEISTNGSSVSQASVNSMSISDDDKNDSSLQNTADPESTAYQSLHNISSNIPIKTPVLVPATDLTRIKDKYNPRLSSGVTKEQERLATIVEADSQAVISEDSLHRNQSSDSSFSMEAELKRRDLPIILDDGKVVYPSELDKLNKDNSSNDSNISERVANSTPLPLDISLTSSSGRTVRTPFVVPQTAISPIPPPSDNKN